MAVSQERLDELLIKHLSRLSRHFRLWIDDDYRFVIVGGVLLPPGYSVRRAKLLIELPPDYPLSPPGVGDSLVYVSPVLQFHERDLKDLHPHREPAYPTPGFGPWAWWCYEDIHWYPKRDNLIRFIEMIRADMTNPPTE